METAFKPLTQEDIHCLTQKPIRFVEGNFAEYIWGGKELYKIKGMKNAADKPIAAESWEVSGHPKYPSHIQLPSGDSQTLINLLKDVELAEKILGREVVQEFSNNFPALVKFFDVQQHMSVQVHPPDHVARQWGETDPGKGEVFVIMDVYANAEGAIYLGLKDGVTREAFTEAMHAGVNLLDFLHKIQMKPGEVYVVPSGIIHCWTGGLMAVEITEPSDLTYRLYDFGRGRPMHLEKGLASIDFENQHGPSLEESTRTQWKPTALKGLSEIHTGNRLRIESILLDDTVGAVDISMEGSFEVLMAIEGAAELSSDQGDWEMTLEKGFSTLIPAGAGDYTACNTANSSSQILRIKVRLEK